jgi:sulfoxide reductase heme-binding subunit YedZ
MGLVQSSRSLVKIKIMGVQTALEIHQTIAVTAFAFLILHITSLFFDEFFLLKIPELIIPLSIKRDFQSALGYDFALPVSIGVIGFYTAIVLLMTSYLRAKKISMKTWRAIHYLSFLGYLSFILHGFLSGSDSNEFWMRTIYITSLSVVLILVIARIFRKKLFFKKSFPTDKKE